jgi:hypothetical protein
MGCVHIRVVLLLIISQGTDENFCHQIPHVGLRYKYTFLFVTSGASERSAVVLLTNGNLGHSATKLYANNLFARYLLANLQNQKVYPYGCVSVWFQRCGGP